MNFEINYCENTGRVMFQLLSLSLIPPWIFGDLREFLNKRILNS